MEDLERLIQSQDFDADRARAQVQAFFQGGRIDRVLMLSALHVIACHPRVADWNEAARLVGEQEFAALEMGGPNLQSNLASVDRHRGVLAFLRGHYEVALDYFSRTLERQRSAENLQNILCTLLKLGEESEAAALLAQIRRSFPSELVEEIDRSIQRDPDLALLRMEAS
jgi:tetratricopeptide (TPR) repeat protein